LECFDLTGRVALVTGGNRGIGLGVAKGLAEAGARLVLGGRDESKGQAAVAELAKLGAEAIFVRADVGSQDGCRKLVEGAVTHFDRLDISRAPRWQGHQHRVAGVEFRDGRLGQLLRHERRNRDAHQGVGRGMGSCADSGQRNPARLDPRPR
jgi:hypothetical protein